MVSDWIFVDVNLQDMRGYMWGGVCVCVCVCVCVGGDRNNTLTLVICTCTLGQQNWMHGTETLN